MKIDLNEGHIHSILFKIIKNNNTGIKEIFIRKQN